MKVPRIVGKTGVSTNYWNEYSARTSCLDWGLSSVAESFREFPVKKYEQRFPPEKYEDVVTAQNRAGVNRLNELSDIVNRTFVDDSRFTELDFKKVINEVHNLIYANGENYIYPKVSGHL